jgi:hypothetical protein
MAGGNDLISSGDIAYGALRSALAIRFEEKVDAKTALPIEKLPLSRVLIRVCNRPLQERHRTGLSREQMSLWLAGYPKTQRFDVRFVPFTTDAFSTSADQCPLLLQ